MTDQPVSLIDPTGAILATGRVTDVESHFEGTIDLSATPAAVKSLFAEFEEVVNGQQFAVLDDVHARIDALGIRARFTDRVIEVGNLQVFPKTGGVSFELRDLPAQPPRPAFSHSATATDPRPVVS